MFVNICGLRLETCFNVPVYQEVRRAQYDIENKIKIRESLTTLSRLELDIPILNATEIEYTLARVVNNTHPKLKIICLWILRQWQIVRKERKVGMTQNLRRTLKPGRILQKIKVQKKHSLLMSEKYVKDKAYLAKEKKAATTLFGMCKAHIEGRLKETLKRKNNDFLLPLVSKISYETLCRAEEQVPTLQEFSSILWQLLIRRDFSSIRHPVIMTCPKEIYFYGLKIKNLLLPMVEETNIPFLLRSLSEPSPSSPRMIRRKKRISSEEPSSFKPNVIEDTQKASVSNSQDLSTSGSHQKELQESPDVVSLLELTEVASTSSECAEVPEDPFTPESPEEVEIASTSAAYEEEGSPEDPLIPDDLSDLEIAEEAEEEEEVEDEEEDDDNPPQIGGCLRVVFVKLGVYVASLFVICAAIASL